MAIKRIYSAGGIVLKSVGSEVKVLLTQHSGHRGWEFPKGHIESGETAQVAAVREVEEEAGVKAKVIGKVGNLEYFYFENGQKVFKKVTYFVMKFLEDSVATTADEVMDLKWVSIGNVEGRLTFGNAKEFWRKTRKDVNELSKSN